MKSIVALGSGKGSTIEFFCQKIQEKNPNFKITALITENPKSGLLKIAKKYNLPYHVIEYNKQNFTSWDQKIYKTLISYNPSLIVLAGFLKKMGPIVLSHFPTQIINSHPSLLPQFGGPGMYGLKVHQAVIKAKELKTGISIHRVNSEYDKGMILAQKTIPIKKNETALELEKRVKEIEKPFYFETVYNSLKKNLTKKTKKIL